MPTMAPPETAPEGDLLERPQEAIAAYRGLLTQTKVPVEPSIAAQLKAQIAAIEAAPEEATVEPMRTPWLE